MKQAMMLGIGIIILILIGGGCMKSTQKRNKPEQIREDMKVYLKEKYGEEFEAVESTLVYADWAYPSDEMQAYPVSDPDKVFLVHRGGDYDIGYSWSDSYFGKLVQPAYEEKAKEMANEYFEDYKLYVTLDNAIYSHELDKNATLEDMLNLENPMFSNSAYINIYIGPSEQTIEALTVILEDYANELKNYRMTCKVDLHIFKEPGLLEKMDRTLISEINRQEEVWRLDRLVVSVYKDVSISAVTHFKGVELETIEN